MAEPDSIHPYLSSMAAVHQIYRSSMDAGPEYIESARGDAQRRALIANFYANILASLESHHIGEDELYFPLLIERVSDQDAEVVNLGFEEHEQVRMRLAETRAAITAWESTGDVASQELLSVLDSLNKAVTLHCDHEEATIVPLATVHLSVEEWNKLGPHGAANFKGDKFWLIAGLRLDCSSPHERASVLDHWAPETREWWDTVGEPSYNNLMAEIRAKQ